MAIAYVDTSSLVAISFDKPGRAGNGGGARGLVAAFIRREDDVTKSEIESGTAETHFLRVFLTSRGEPLIFSVSRDDSERFQQSTQQWDGATDTYFCAATRDGLDFAVNLRHIVLANVLWEPDLPGGGNGGGPSRSGTNGQPEHEEGDFNITLWFADDRAPYVFATEDYNFLAQVFLTLDSGIDDSTPFLVLLDEDGEEVLVNGKLLAAISAPTEWVEQGRQGILG